jgi:hypothetical protein
MDNNLMKRLARIRDDLDAVIAEVANNTGIEPPDMSWHRWFRRAGGVLNDVDEAGGSVTPEGWRDIGLRHDYDPRGLAGFYSGRDPSMRREPGADARVLTERGKIEAQNWRRLFRERS